MFKLRRKPDFAIGDPGRPYMLRWYLLPRNRWFNLYLHKIVRDDDDRALHDHPWGFVSLVLKGRYLEILGRHTKGDGFSTFAPDANVERRRFTLAVRKAGDRHRVTLPRDGNGDPIPCWTMIATGPRVRDWGFHCPKGWIPWQLFCDSTNRGNVGRGCGET